MEREATQGCVSALPFFNQPAVSPKRGGLTWRSFLFEKIAPGCPKDAPPGAWAPSPLPDAENDACADAQQVLFIAFAIGQLCTQVVGLDGADGDVLIDGQIEPSAGQDRPRVGRSGQRTAGAGEQTVEAVGAADKPLHKGGKFSACETGAEARPDSEGDQRQATACGCADGGSTLAGQVGHHRQRAKGVEGD